MLAASTWHSSLPQTIEAIAFHVSTVDPSGGSEAESRRIHAAFRAAYPSSDAPLLSFDIRDDEHPFAEVV